ncbi:MAG: bifunctional demethylmenaquinone methyltransferase/2-methoxy-6-polyprenyl-1,4-benzoquinol methylase UbiE [Anaerolineae bacterium]
MVPTHDKATYVRRMFDAIVARYDLMNRLMTAGRDEAWRRQAARQAVARPGGKILDVAAGTADLTLALARQNPSARIIALDFSLGMMQRGVAKVQAHSAGERIRFVAGDALALPFADNSFDVVTSGFLMRNVTDIVRTFAEMRRVVRPGGRVVCLEISKPVLPVFSLLFWWYFARVVPVMGRLVSGNAEAYRYLPQSLAQFVTAEELKAFMEQAGLTDVTYRRLMLGTVAIHVGRKP